MNSLNKTCSRVAGAALAAASLFLFSAPSNAQPAQESVGYYFGTTTQTLPDGRPAGSMDCLVKRSLYPAEGLLIEIDACVRAGAAKATEFVLVAAVAGSVYRFVELGGAFRGSGTLSGPAWAWTSWKSRSTMGDGGVVESSDRMTGAGIETDKKYFNAAGALVVNMREDLRPISKDDYAERRGKLFPNQ